MPAQHWPSVRQRLLPPSLLRSHSLPLPRVLPEAERYSPCSTQLPPLRLRHSTESPPPESPQSHVRSHLRSHSARSSSPGQRPPSAPKSKRAHPATSQFPAGVQNRPRVANCSSTSPDRDRPCCRPGCTPSSTTLPQRGLAVPAASVVPTLPSTPLLPHRVAAAVPVSSARVDARPSLRPIIAPDPDTASASPQLHPGDRPANAIQPCSSTSRHCLLRESRRADSGTRRTGAQDRQLLHLDPGAVPLQAGRFFPASASPGL